jgi:NAD+ synthase
MEGFELTREQLAHIQNAITKAIKVWVAESKKKGVVFGLSGGVDSALVCKLAAYAGVDAHALILPERGLTPEADVEDALSLARQLKVKHTVLHVNDIVDAVKETYGKKMDCVCLGNIKARARMLLLYLTANTEGRIVLGTSNRTELLTGYYTKHGDGAADYLPIGGLYKTQVRQLARHMGVPSQIIDKKPSAGLWRGQCDEDELGLDYDTLDRMLYMMFEEWMKPDEVAGRLNLDKRDVLGVFERVESARHKLNGPGMVPPIN